MRMQLDLAQSYRLFSGVVACPGMQRLRSVCAMDHRSVVETVLSTMGLIFPSADRRPAPIYERGMNSCSEALWGARQ